VRRTSRSQLTIAMESTLTADRVDYDRGRVALIKNLNRCVDLLDVNEAARADLKKSKRIVIQVAVR